MRDNNLAPAIKTATGLKDLNCVGAAVRPGASVHRTHPTLSRPAQGDRLLRPRRIHDLHVERQGPMPLGGLCFANLFADCMVSAAGLAGVQIDVRRADIRSLGNAAM